MKPYVVAFSGRIASGKSTISQGVATTLGWPRASFGDYVRETALSRGFDPEDRSVLQEIGELLVRDPDVFCRSVLARFGFVHGQGFVIDGIRHLEVLEELRRAVAPQEVCLIYVEAPETAIHRRLMEERVEDGKIDAWEQHSTETQVQGSLAGLAELVVQNSDARPMSETAQEILRFLLGKAE